MKKELYKNWNVVDADNGYKQESLKMGSIIQWKKVYRKVDYAKLSIVHPMQSSRLCKVRFNIPYK